MISAAAVLFAGCTRPPNAASQPGADGGPGGKGGKALSLPSGRPESELVEGYLRYQRALAAAQRPRVPHTPQSRAWELLRAEAQAEEKALQAAGLNEAELERVEPLVLEVLGRVRALRAVRLDETLATYEQIRARLPEKSREELDPALEDLKTRQTKLASMDDERARFGGAAVDAVLARQKELLDAQDAWWALQAGPAARP